MDTQEKIIYRKILVINLGGIGDVLLSTPALRALKQANPEAQLEMLVVPRVLEIVAGLPYIDSVHVFHRSIFYAFPDIRELMRLRAKHFDLAINMRTLVSKTSAAKMKRLLGFIHPAKIAGRNTDGRGDFFDISIPEESVGTKFEMEYDIALVKKLGAEAVDRRIDFMSDAESEKKVQDLMRNAGIEGSDCLVGIHPGGKPSHRWPLENFAALMQRLRLQKNCKFVVTGDSNETHLAQKLAGTAGINVLNVAGVLAIKEIAALMKQCKVFIANDTGIIHVAVCAGVPLVAIFGPGYLDRYDPRVISDKAIVVYNKAECAPCDKVTCNDMRCLKTITPDDVMTAMQRFF